MRTFKLLEKRRVRLEGAELEEHFRQKRQREEEEMQIKKVTAVKGYIYESFKQVKYMLQF